MGRTAKKEKETSANTGDVSQVGATDSDAQQLPKSTFLDLSTFSYEEFASLAHLDVPSRLKEISQKTTQTYTKDDIKRVVPMTFIEELWATSLFLFGLPGAVFSVPVVLLLVGLYLGNVGKAFFYGALVIAPLSLLPIYFRDSNLSTWAALQILKYFSFKIAYDERIEENKPYILVAPPHGVFPFGNIITMIAFPTIMGFSFRGLAATAAMRLPIFRQILGFIGGIDASRKSAMKALKNNRTIGISTGGVAEVFETNSPTGDEVIVLKSRKGIIKLAFRTGASLVPCYLFGNTKLFSLFTGGSFHDFFRKLSRRLGFATIVFWGRLGLPVPYRIPIFGVMSKPIHVPIKENPTDEEIEKVHVELMNEMVKVFDRYKGAYGWEHKKLVIM